MATKKKKTSTTKAPAKKAAKKSAAAKPAAAPAKKAAKKSAAAKPKKAAAAAKKTTKKTTTKKAASKKTAAKKPATKKAASKKTAAKKPATKKTAAKKPASKKTAAKKTASKKTASKKPATKKAATKKAVSKKTATKKAASKKTASKKTATKKAASKKTASAKKTASTSTKAVATKADAVTVLHAPPTGHGNVYLGARTVAVPASYEASATLVPGADDALDEAMGDAFDTLFSTPPKPVKSQKPSEPFVPGDPSLDLAQICAALALEKKAEDVVILQVAELTSYADFFVIAAATSDRQAQGVARTISDELRKNGRQPLSTDGMDQGNWVVLDYGSVVVHVFMNSARAYYDLDGFWSDAPQVTVDEARGQGALAHLAAQQPARGDEAS